MDKRAKETEELKGRVLELEVRNVLLKAKVSVRVQFLWLQKFEVFPTLSLKTFTHFTFPLRTYQTNSLSLPSFSNILTNQDIRMDEHQWITDIF